MTGKRHRAEASNADKYNCPSCWHMNGERNLKICMTCEQGDKYKKYEAFDFIKSIRGNNYEQ